MYVYIDVCFYVCCSDCVGSVGMFVVQIGSLFIAGGRRFRTIYTAVCDLRLTNS